MKQRLLLCRVWSVRTFCTAGAFFLCLLSAAQRGYSASNGHAHNDYLNPRPFHLAFQAGFGSIEADVFPGEGKLYVAHTKREIRPENTLKELYLLPLLRECREKGGRQLNLLIDIKENYAVTLPLLVEELQPLRPYLSTPGKINDITVTVSGNRPAPADYRAYPDFIFFDDDLKRPHSESEWRRVALVSLPFNRLSAWKGAGDPSRADRKRIRHLIDSVHAAGKPIRFWAAPDTEASWKWQARLKADLIGTDQVEALGDFLGRQKGHQRGRRKNNSVTQ